MTTAPKTPDDRPAEPPASGAPGVRLSLFYVAIFSAIGVHMPFWPVWLESQGYTGAEIGALLGALFWAKVIGNPIAGHLADSRGRRRRVMIGLAACALASFCAFLVVEGFWPLFFLSLASGGFFAAMLPLGESLTMLTCYTRGLDYGRIRLWGSLAFIALAVGSGRLLTITGPWMVLWLIIGALTVLLCVMPFLPDPGTGARRAEPAPPSALSVLAHPVFLLFLLTGGLLQSSHALYYGFASLHWKAAGIGEDVIGLLWGIGVLAEVVLFALSGRVVAWLGPARLLLLAGLGGALRWTVLASTTEVWLLLPAQMLHAATFGCAHLAAMHFIARATPPALASRAQALYSSIAMGAALGLATMAAGPIYQWLGGQAFLFSLGLSMTGGICALALARRWHGTRLVTGADGRRSG